MNPQFRRPDQESFDAGSAATFSRLDVTQILQITPAQLEEWERTFFLKTRSHYQDSQVHYSHRDLANLIIVQRLAEAGHANEVIIERLQQAKTVNTTQTDSIDIESGETAHNQTRNLHQTSPTVPYSVQFQPDQHYSNGPEKSGLEPHPIPEKINDNFDQRVDQAAYETHSTPHSVKQPFAQADSNDSIINIEQEQFLPAKKNDQSEIISQPVNEMLGEMLSTVANSQQSMLNVQDSIREMLGVIAQDNFNLT